MTHEISGDELFFSKEAAEYLGITTQRLNKLIQEGKIHPLKKNASGTVFHVDELNKRKEELSIFTRAEQGGRPGMFEFDSMVKMEALNFATLMNVLDVTENKLDPMFSMLANIIDVAVPIPTIVAEYSGYFNVPEETLIREFNAAKRAFSKLRPTDEIIKRGSKDYPPLLLQTEQAPRFLYIRGKKSLLQEKRTVALVGSRQASEQSKESTRRLATSLGRNGITVISGLAKGIDATAHRAALDNGYNTVSVIVTNLNQYYPAENKDVQIEIEKKGLVVSQFSPATKTQRWFFPLRNGVMSGLSLATVIMEAGETSGALKQADFALKQGRLVLIPQKALEMTSITWPARYVERGAIVVRTPADVLKELASSKIFRVIDPAPVQQTMDRYLEEQVSRDTKKGNVHWVDPVTVEE